MKRANRRRANRRVEQKQSFNIRLRPLKRGIQAFFIGLAVVGAGLGVYEYREHLSVDDGLILEVVEISGQYRASEEEILMYSGLKRGTPLLDVDLEKVARAVRAHPWVKHVTVRRQLVDKVTIKVWEHQPAYLASIDKLYLVSDEFLIFKQFTSRDVLDLPIVSGLTEKSPKAHFAEAQELLAELKPYQEFLGFVAEVRFDDTLGWSVVFEPGNVSKGFVVHLGQKPKRELVLTKLLIEALANQGMDPAEVWLGTGHDSNRIPLRIRSRSNNSISNSLIAEAG